MDETPKRIRGLKEREAAYRQGFLDGCEYGRDEAKRDQEIGVERRQAADVGLAKYRRTLATVEPKRRRKKSNGVEANLDVARVS